MAARLAANGAGGGAAGGAAGEAADETKAAGISELARVVPFMGSPEMALWLAARWLSLPELLALRVASGAAKAVATDELGARIAADPGARAAIARALSTYTHDHAGSKRPWPVVRPTWDPRARKQILALLAARAPVAHLRELFAGTFMVACARGDLELAVWVFALKLPKLGSPQFGTKARAARAFTVACRSGELEVAQWLWSLGLDLRDIRADNARLILDVCALGHLDILRWLWSLGLELRDLREQPRERVEYAGNRKGGPFALACARGRLPVARWLMEAGVTLAEARSRGCYAYRLARLPHRGIPGRERAGAGDVVQWLESVGAA